MKANFTNCYRPQQFLFFLIFIYLYGCSKETIYNDKGESFNYEPKEIATGVQLGEVYKTNNFAAFTDIVYFNNAWYITFRIGTQHSGGLNGEIKIMQSNDAVTWTVKNIITNDSLDLRDPKFVLDSVNNKLYLNYTGIKINQGNFKVYAFITSYNQSEEAWNVAQVINNNDTSGNQFLFWRLTYSQGKIYTAAYHVPILGGYTVNDICLFNTESGYQNYLPLGKLTLGNSPDEATIRFDSNGKMYLLIRRELADVALGVSEPAAYCNVTWSDPLSIKLASPNFLFYNGKLLITGRGVKDLKFKLFSYNLATNKIEKEFTFPSGYETGYGGMSFNPANKDELWISYYSITSSKSYIYLSKIDLKAFLQ